MTFIRPEVLADKFTCPSCQAISQQHWWMVDENGGARNRQNTQYAPFRVGTCVNCNKYTLWVFKEIVYPPTSFAPPKNTDTPEDVAEIYQEAADIFARSPRAAAALLRLGVQLLCKHLGESGKHIDTDIKALVAKGLPPMVQQSLDIVRVIGNNAVHPGAIDVDDSEVVFNLFNLLNIIVEYMITMPNRVSSLYAALPVNSLAAITKRDQ
jgi:Domain of unknown function (DUF4145)